MNKKRHIEALKITLTLILMLGICFGLVFLTIKYPIIFCLALLILLYSSVYNLMLEDNKDNNETK